MAWQSWGREAGCGVKMSFIYLGSGTASAELTQVSVGKNPPFLARRDQGRAQKH